MAPAPVKSWSIAAAASAVALAAAVPSLAGGGSARDATLERGRYLAHQVAMCVQCHSPRDPDGELVGSRLFQGGVVPFESPFEGRPWAFRAPHIAGLPGYTEDEGVRLLSEGIKARGGRPAPPMPPFRMEPDDARAVVRYLKSL